MYKFKAKLAFFLVLCILICSVNSMKVEAAEIVAGAGITASTVFEICLFVGGVALTCYAAGEIVENRDEIAKFGKDFIDSISLDSVPDGWLFNFMDADTGQEYVVGSEVIDYIQSCVWLGIIGELASGGDNQEPDKEPDKNKKDWLNFASPSSQLYASFSALGATWFADSISKLYQKWVNGDELTESEQAALKPLMEAGVDQNDIAKQWSGEPFSYSSSITQSYITKSPAHSRIETSNYIGDFAFPVCGVYSSGSCHIFSFLYSYDGNASALNKFSLEVSSYVDGVYRGISNYANRGSWSSQYISVVDNLTFTYSANFPIFSSQIEAEAYLKGTGAVTDALNYSHTYENADWLSDDWKGLLIDPLTNIGLSLSQLTDLAKALGVHAVGNNLSAQELADLLKQSLPAVNPELMPDAVPVSPIVPDPGLKPIYYPSPTAHPLPDTDPGTNPGGDPDVTPDTDPKPSEILDPDEIVPDTAADFSDISGTLKRKFPFSLPWDVYYLFTVLADTPKTPRFEIPFYIDRLGIHEVVVIDLSPFESVSKLSRLFLTLFFCYGLMNLTVKIVSVRKED